VKAKVALIEPGENGAVTVRYEDQLNGGTTTASHDLVVLSLGKVPGWNPEGRCALTVGPDGFISGPEPKLAPTRTVEEGLFAAGAAVGVKDIVDSIAEASAAAMHAANYLQSRKKALEAVA
jgi:heterodisulfide reductase subunit A